MNTNAIVSAITKDRMRELRIDNHLDLDGRYYWHLSGVCNHCNEPISFVSRPIRRTIADAVISLREVARSAVVGPGAFCNSGCVVLRLP